MRIQRPPDQPETEEQFAALPIEERALQWARHWCDSIKVREVGINAGYWVEKFLGWAGIGRGWAWCASFVHACYLHAGWDSKRGGVSHPARVREWRNWAKRTGRIVEDWKRVERGMLFFWINGDGLTGHIGFVVRRERNTAGGHVIHTIEGNASNERGQQGCFRRIRLWSKPHRFFAIDMRGVS
jgi:hypothetical protein